jgi:hypothetical protein
MDVAKVGCCICCNGCTRMLQTSVSNVSFVLRHMLQVCLSRCFIYFTHMLQVFYLDVAYVCNDFQVFSGVFSNVSDACLKYFICLQTYVASVASRCFKSRSGVAHIAV